MLTADAYSCQAETPEKVRCAAQVQKKLVGCEHSAKMACSADPAKVFCSARCGLTMSCCGKQCTDTCGSCQRRSGTAAGGIAVPRSKHADHHCGKNLYCQHSCQGKCSQDHDCSEEACASQCRQSCSHHTCPLPCSQPCPPCMEPCLWTCEHHKCYVVCGAVSGDRILSAPPAV